MADAKMAARISRSVKTAWRADGERRMKIGKDAAMQDTELCWNRTLHPLSYFFMSLFFNI